MCLISRTELVLAFFPFQMSVLVHNICFNDFLKATHGLFHGIFILIP